MKVETLPEDFKVIKRWRKGYEDEHNGRVIEVLGKDV